MTFVGSSAEMKISDAARNDDSDLAPSSPLPLEQPEREDRGSSQVFRSLEGTNRALGQLQRSLRQPVACLSTAAHDFAWELDSRKLFQRLAEHAARITGAERTISYWVDESKIERAGWYPAAQQNQSANQPVPHEVLDMVRRPEPKLVAQPRSATTAGHNAILVPLLGTQNRLLGLLECRQKRWGGVFAETDLELAIALARVATAAIDRSRLFHRMIDWSKSMEMLLSFNAAVNRHMQPSELVKQLVINAAGFVDADGGAAGLVINQDQGTVMESESCFFGGQWYPFERRWQAFQGVAGTVLETKFPLLLSNYSENALADHEIKRRFQPGPCICIPIKNAQQDVLGFFKFFRVGGKPEFTWQEAALLESLGNTAAVAIENARLVKSLELKNEQIKKLSAAHVRRLEEERRHIARELHDEAGQVLIGLKLRLQLLSKRLPAENGSAVDDLNSLREQVNEAAARLSGLAKRLRPPTLDELGFEATLRQLVDEFCRQFDLSIQLEIDNQRGLSEEAETTLYRIVQEGLTNIVKHAAATRVLIRLQEESSGPSLEILDNGCGFDTAAAHAGLGLVGIQERVMMLGATISITSRIGHGTCIRIYHLPPRKEAGP